MNKTSISWCMNPDGTPGFTWNPAVGCSPVSSGCANCWAAALASTRLEHLAAYSGLTKNGRWTGSVRFFPEKLAEPLRRRKPAGIFVIDMGDIAMLPREQIAAIFGVMAATPQHCYFMLTKRPGLLREWFRWCGDPASWYPFAVELAKHGIGCNEELRQTVASHPLHLPREKRWPLPNVVIGASVCTKADLSKLDELHEIPAAIRFVSFEPLLEDLGKLDLRGIGWAIPGGESGPHARPCHVGWIRSIVEQCKQAGTRVHVKQLGTNARAVYSKESFREWEPIVGRKRILVWSERGQDDEFEIQFRDRAGSDPSEWPEDLRIRQPIFERSAR